MLNETVKIFILGKIKIIYKNAQNTIDLALWYELRTTSNLLNKHKADIFIT